MRGPDRFHAVGPSCFLPLTFHVKRRDGFALPTNRCTVGALLERLPDVERDYLTELLADPRNGGPWLRTVLRDAGHDVPLFVISRHRRRAANGCRCPL